MTDKADNDALVRDELAAMRKREVQLIGAGISMRDWHATEIGYNQLRDRIDGFILCLAALRTPQPEVDGSEREQPIFLTATVSEDTTEIGIDHPTEADWKTVLDAHIALRDRLNERIAEQSKCPFKPEATHPQPDETEMLRAEVVRLLGVLHLWAKYNDVESIDFSSVKQMNAFSEAWSATLQALKGTDHGRG